MSLFTKLKSLGKYFIYVQCKNCGLPNKLAVKKGTTVAQFAKNGEAICQNCGTVIKFQEYSTEWLK